MITIDYIIIIALQGWLHYITFNQTSHKKKGRGRIKESKENKERKIAMGFDNKSLNWETQRGYAYYLQVTYFTKSVIHYNASTPIGDHYTLNGHFTVHSEENTSVTESRWVCWREIHQCLMHGAKSELQSTQVKQVTWTQQGLSTSSLVINNDHPNVTRMDRWTTLPHPSCGHTKSLSPVWIRKCLFNFELSKNFCRKKQFKSCYSNLWTKLQAEK